jgi:predicted MFS family arabinose efflux permease
MNSMMGPTRQAWVGDLLSGDDLPKGVALTQMMMNVTRIAGPLIAGAFIAAEPIGSAGTYVGMAVLFALVVFILTRMEATPPRPRERVTSVHADLAEGFQYIWKTPDVRLLAIVFAGTVLCGFTYMTIMPGYLENALDVRTTLLGALYSTTAVGGIIVTLALASWKVKNPVATMLMFGAAFAGSLSLLAIAPGFGAALAASAVVGATSSGFQMLNNVNLMERTDPQYFGRVMAVTMMAFGLNSIFSLPVGLVADAVGERATLFGLSAASLSVVLLGLFAMRTIPARAPMHAPVSTESGVASPGGR